MVPALGLAELPAVQQVTGKEKRSRGSDVKDHGK